MRRSLELDAQHRHVRQLAQHLHSSAGAVCALPHRGRIPASSGAQSGLSELVLPVPAKSIRSVRLCRARAWFAGRSSAARPQRPLLGSIGPDPTGSSTESTGRDAEAWLGPALSRRSRVHRPVRRDGPAARGSGAGRPARAVLSNLRQHSPWLTASRLWRRALLLRSAPASTRSRTTRVSLRARFEVVLQGSATGSFVAIRTQ